MKILRTRHEFEQHCEAERKSGRRIGLVPTMGALHQGHLSLVRRAIQAGDTVVASVFVNPTQFNNANDLATYPRCEADDFALLESAGVGAVFAPTVEEMYPGGQQRDHDFDLGTVAEVMEGRYRPGHFQGVAQVVSRLMRMAGPCRAYFGQKDYQQIAVLRRMKATEGLDDVEIVACPIHRGEDGLAIESKTLTLGAYGGDMDFYAMKGAIEAILQELRVKDVTFRIGSGLPEELSYHPGRFAEVWSGSDCLGWFGQIHPLVAKNYGVDAEFYCAELAMDELENAKGADPEYVPLPKFPAVTRDIAVVCDRAVTVGALEDCIRRGAKGLLKDVSLFDIYTGSGIPEGKKSVAFNLTLRSDDRSLTAQEADEDVKSILETLKAELNAVLR